MIKLARYAFPLLVLVVILTQIGGADENRGSNKIDEFKLRFHRGEQVKGTHFQGSESDPVGNECSSPTDQAIVHLKEAMSLVHQLLSLRALVEHDFVVRVPPESEPRVVHLSESCALCIRKGIICGAKGCGSACHDDSCSQGCQSVSKLHTEQEILTLLTIYET